MSAPDLYLATHPDGSQTLVTLYDGLSGEVAYRPNGFASWGAPTPLEVAP